MPPDQPREIMMPVPEHDALTMTHIEALRAVGGQVSMLNTTVAGMAADIKSTREEVIKLVAQDLKATISANRAESKAEIDKLRDDHDADIKEVAAKAEANSRSISWLRGVLLPLSVFGSAALTGLVTWLATAFGVHHP